jgi:1,4-alpha-glucan branching enzyme
MIRKESHPDGHMVKVTFSLPTTLWAESVALVGDFNQWNPTSHPLHQSRSSGEWEIVLLLPSGKAFQFRYLINGTDWHNDWHADRYEPNVYGSDNSVVLT